MREPEPNYNQSRVNMIYEPTGDDSPKQSFMGSRHMMGRNGHALSKSFNPNATGETWVSRKTKFADDYSKTRDKIKTYRSINFKSLM